MAAELFEAVEVLTVIESLMEVDAFPSISSVIVEGTWAPEAAM